MYKKNRKYVSGETIMLATNINGEPVKVKRKEIRGYVENPEFQVALEYYHYTKLWGMPNGQGWANVPHTLLAAITALEIEAKALEHEEMEAISKKTKGGSKG